MKPIVSAILFTLCSSVSALADDSVLLSHLQPGDRLHVAYHSRGCFHDRTYDIDFARGASVTATSSGRVITLSAREVSGLDRLLVFYRSHPSGGCTTEDEISISHFREGHEVSADHYVDGSCATGRMKDVTRLYEIAQKLGLQRDS